MPKSTTLRGYGAKHQKERDSWRPHVVAGLVTCWRCGQPIPPRSVWDLGHDDNDRSRYRGPEHRRCNRAAGARKGNARRKQRNTVTQLRW